MTTPGTIIASGYPLSDSDLKPCPFCGSADVELRVSCTDAGVACNNCGCRTGLVQLGPDAASEAYRKREVVEVWNKRIDAEIAPLVEALARTQWELETIARTRSTNFSTVADLILANRPVLARAAIAKAKQEERT